MWSWRPKRSGSSIRHADRPPGRLHREVRGSLPVRGARRHAPQRRRWTRVRVPDRRAHRVRVRQGRALQPDPLDVHELGSRFSETIGELPGPHVPRSRGRPRRPTGRPTSRPISRTPTATRCTTSGRPRAPTASSASTGGRWVRRRAGRHLTSIERSRSRSTSSAAASGSMTDGAGSTPVRATSCTCRQAASMGSGTSRGRRRRCSSTSRRGHRARPTSRASSAQPSWMRQHGCGSTSDNIWVDDQGR